MTTQVEFVVLKNSRQWLLAVVDSLNSLNAIFSRIILIADERNQIEQIDEYLWQNSMTKFIPNALEGECFSHSTAVILTTEQPEGRRFQALVNLTGQMQSNPQQYQSIVEFVKTEEENKEQSRLLFKNYRQLGFQVQHRELATSYE